MATFGPYYAGAVEAEDEGAFTWTESSEMLGAPNGTFGPATGVAYTPGLVAAFDTTSAEKIVQEICDADPTALG